MKGFLRQLVLWTALLFLIALLLSVGQWLSAPVGYGADAWLHLYEQRGQRTRASVLRAGRKAGTTPFVSAVVNSRINVPRDRLLRACGYLYVENAMFFYSIPHRLFTDDARAILMFALGTVIVYFPIPLALAIFLSRRRQRPSEAE